MVCIMVCIMVHRMDASWRQHHGGSIMVHGMEKTPRSLVCAPTMQSAGERGAAEQRLD
jgi:hypothetical protein